MPDLRTAHGRLIHARCISLIRKLLANGRSPHDTISPVPGTSEIYGRRRNSGRRFYNGSFRRRSLRLGALAIGRFTIGAIAAEKAAIKSLSIDQFTVKRLRVEEPRRFRVDDRPAAIASRWRYGCLT